MRFFFLSILVCVDSPGTEKSKAKKDRRGEGEARVFVSLRDNIKCGGGEEFFQSFVWSSIAAMVDLYKMLA